MKLLVNKLEVPKCACGSTEPHWSGQDIKKVLDRDVLDADLFEFEFAKI